MTNLLLPLYVNNITTVKYYSQMGAICSEKEAPARGSEGFKRVVASSLATASSAFGSC
ncbi:hypothetical protein HanXRQr2_Chr03g0093381 [Helianthus annuus]|uniref:Uncharacterized protein n=1 Tax=Helianthus annuus TaxID=4232 RepID=A0A9K3NVI4_HELAN|nr:hypothetical protein HanXRQr2_Chr03g0093381 [Helianthus annuus]